MKRITACLLLVALSPSVWAIDTADEQRLAGIQEGWAYIQYEVPTEQRTAAFEKLATQTTAFTQERHPWPKPGFGPVL